MQFSIPFLISLFCLISADDVFLQKRMYYPEEAGVREPFDPKMKKPFCNAFTGCGKKRSGGPSMVRAPIESMATLVDLNSEPAVEELTRQILSEAKLWEAIQEARLELNRKKESDRERASYHQVPLPLTGVHKRSSQQYLYT